jgi:hypothetical protein
MRISKEKLDKLPLDVKGVIQRALAEDTNELVSFGKTKDPMKATKIAFPGVAPFRQGNCVPKHTISQMIQLQLIHAKSTNLHRENSWHHVWELTLDSLREEQGNLLSLPAKTSGLASLDNATRNQALKLGLTSILEKLEEETNRILNALEELSKQE